MQLLIIRLWVVGFSLMAIVSTPRVMADVVKVEAFKPQKVERTHRIALSGTVAPVHSAELASQQVGVVSHIFVEAGDEVDTGQALLQLDDTLAKLQLAQAKAEQHIADVALQEAKRLLKELEKLSQSQLAAQTQLAQRQAEVLTAQARVQNANAKVALQEELLARHKLSAPFAGLIHARSVDVGEWLSTSTQAFQLVSHANKRLELAVPQQYAQYMAQTSEITATIVSDATQGDPFTSKVDRVVRSIDFGNRTFQLFVSIPFDAPFVVGSSAQAFIDLPTANKEIIWVPKSALKRHPDGGHSLFAVENGKAKRVFVKIVDQQPEQVAVSGASSEYTYVKAGIELLKDGQALLLSATSEPEQ
ncbi:efflux transporter, RND family, MFP subunit [Pseudoalteromonas luteoviolacea B = ATCC 29581]|nr:efflux transporter, RND family, MFP subunit [Pseudoalteromonas luteoviolacea B = ATCC 29581]